MSVALLLAASTLFAEVPKPIKPIVPLGIIPPASAAARMLPFTLLAPETAAEMAPLLNHPLLVPLMRARSSVIDSDQHLFVVSPDGSQAFAVPKDVQRPVREINLDQDVGAALQAARIRGDLPAEDEISRAFFDRARARQPSASEDGAEAAPRPAEQPGDPELDYAHRPQVRFGTESLPIIVRPDEEAKPGVKVDISQLWGRAKSQSKRTLVVAHEFDDMDMAKRIVEAADAGEEILFIGDYSHWFPERMPSKRRKGKDQKPPQAAESIQLLKQFLSDHPERTNFKVSILKGLTSIGINHNKFTLFDTLAGEELLEAGSFNYTKRSQLYHWENVIFSNDKERIEYFKKYHEWLMRRARPYSPDLMPEDPTFDPADPILTPPESPEITLHDVPFPKVSFSPDGGTEDLLVKAISLVKQTLDCALFNASFTPKIAAAILDACARKVQARTVMDKSQLRTSAHKVLPLVEGGMELKVLEGPDREIDHSTDPKTSWFSKLHSKIMAFDVAQSIASAVTGMVMAGCSLNPSFNACFHNFENTQFWVAWTARYIHAHITELFALGHDVDLQTLNSLARENLLALHLGQSGALADGPNQPEDAGEPY